LKNIIKLDKIEDLHNGINIAHFTLEIKLPNYEHGLIFKLSSAGINLRIESSHLIKEINLLLEWLNKSSDNENTLKDNESEIISYAKEMIRCNKKLKEIKKF